MQGAWPCADTAEDDVERVRLDKPKPATLGDDLLWSAAEIAAYLGIKVRRVYYLIEAKNLPVRRLSPKSFVARKSELTAWFSAHQEPRH